MAVSGASVKLEIEKPSISSFFRPEAVNSPARQRANALRFPPALFKKPLTLEEYLTARAIAEPLHLFDCVMPCAGADGFLVLSEERAQRLQLPYARVLGTIERHNAFATDPVQMRAGWALDRADLYEQAGFGPPDMDFVCTYDDYPVITVMQLEDLGFCGKGEASQFIREHSFTWEGSFPLNTSGGQLSVGQAGVGPEDMDFVETYDDYPVISLMQLEDLGFCDKGEGPAFVRKHGFTWDGSFPLNTSGGQLSVGQAGAAGGYLGLVESMRQLSGSAGGRQVKDARLGLASGFGMINYDRGLGSGAAILGSSKA